ncbi:16S rRNA (guanine(527)-N(7))-methyltransferase RsmG [Motilibacter sp. E257]|uniref:Ribosomal RNA small subunit methyltransferase G n=1 Tax=Motilibacter deserti TaxID=2714956 RepID=A0ABX0H0F3_9ACTN|nr:16S rRNA (guanine(527)-N(7))-methyltransferase RsmG [Motilibacter deserti]
MPTTDVEPTAPVPRGTGAPVWAADVFGPRLAQATAYAELLAGAGIERGLLGPREADRVWGRHIGNSALVAELLPETGRLADIGSGAGLPGIPIALRRPQLEVVLVEPLLRRSQFLTEVVDELGLDNVTVVRERAEKLPKRSFDLVTARAVAPLPKLSQWALPLLRAGGTLLALKGQSASAELEEARSVLGRLAAEEATIEQVENESIGESATIVRVRKQGGARTATTGKDGQSA